MNTKLLSKVLITISIAALFIVPMTFVILQTNNNSAKKAEAYNPKINTERYYGTNGTGQYYNSTFDSFIPDQNIFTDPFGAFNNTYYDTNGNPVAVSDFNQTVFDANGNYSYSKEYQADLNCSYYLSDNCSNFPLTPESDYSIYNDYQEPYVFDVPKPNNYQVPYIFDVPEPKTYNNYYNPYQENIQDPLKPYYPEQDFNLDPGYYNS